MNSQLPEYRSNRVSVFSVMPLLYSSSCTTRVSFPQFLVDDDGEPTPW